MTRPSEILGSVVAASEREQLETFLDYLRDAVVRKARGVSEEDARRSPVPTGTNLGGLIKHLRWVELGGFAEQIGQIPAAELPTPPWTDADPEADLRLEPNEKLDDVIKWAERELAGSASCRLRVDGVHELYRHCEPRGVVHPRAPLRRTDWGTDEFGLLDLDGNLVTLYEQVADTH